MGEGSVVRKIRLIARAGLGLGEGKVVGEVVVHGGSFAFANGLDLSRQAREHLARHDDDAVGVSVQNVPRLDLLTVESYRFADVYDVEIAMGHDEVTGKVLKAKLAHFVDIPHAAIGDHADSTEALGERRHHLTAEGAARRRSADVLDDEHRGRWRITQ